MKNQWGNKRNEKKKGRRKNYSNKKNPNFNENKE